PQVGVVVTSTLLGSAALTIAVGLGAHQLQQKMLLLAASALMLLTGLLFAGLTSFWAILVIAFVGTLNPSSGDVSVFLPTEQAVLAETVRPRERTAIFAWYNLSGTFAGALGALASGLPDGLSKSLGVSVLTAERSAFWLYAAVAACCSAVYSRLSGRVEIASGPKARPLAQSKKIVLKLAAYFSLDAFGGGFV